MKDLKLQIDGEEEFSYSKRVINDVDVEDIVKEAAKRYKQFPEELYTGKKKSLFVRKFAIYLSKRLTGLTNTEIGEIFVITYSSVSKSVKDMERILKEDLKVRRDVEPLISHFKV